MKKVMAQGMFEILHPGQLYYLEKSAELGDELHVVVGRDKWAVNRNLVMDENSRLRMVRALEVVDNAILGSEESMFKPVERIDPDVITLGYDQDFSIAEIEGMLAEKGMEDTEVVRIDEYEGTTKSVSQIKSRILEG